MRLEAGVQGDGRMRTGEKRQIYLIGFMGSGKSTVSRILSGRLKVPCVEMDEELERQAGKRITEIFREDGEACFRAMESRLLESLGESPPCVVSCGGGAVLREENVRAMKSGGVVVLLSASAATIYERVKNSRTRPVLNGHMNTEYIEALMREREPFYRAASDLTVETDEKTVEEIAGEIIAGVESYRDTQKAGKE